jgi:branched-subunit amino acid transport protein
MSTQLVWLALLMAAVTYPSRAIPLLAPGMHRLPPVALEYIRMVGPAVLATIAAVEVFVAVDAARHPSFHVGLEWPAVGVCLLVVAARRSLLIGLIAAAAIAAIARAAGLGV